MPPDPYKNPYEPNSLKPETFTFVRLRRHRTTSGVTIPLNPPAYTLAEIAWRMAKEMPGWEVATIHYSDPSE